MGMITVKLKDDMHKRLKQYGTVGDSLSDVVEGLLNYYESKEGKPQKKLKL
jgi:predicted CopG family antitoxin